MTCVHSNYIKLKYCIVSCVLLHKINVILFDFVWFGHFQLSLYFIVCFLRCWVWDEMSVFWLSARLSRCHPCCSSCSRQVATEADSNCATERTNLVSWCGHRWLECVTVVTVCVDKHSPEADVLKVDLFQVVDERPSNVETHQLRAQSLEQEINTSVIICQTQEATYRLISWVSE